LIEKCNIKILEKKYLDQNWYFVMDLVAIKKQGVMINYGTDTNT
jgi:hypothetical protein